MYIFAFMRMRPWQRIALILGLVASILGLTSTLSAHPHRSSPWTMQERRLLRSLALTSEMRLPSDPSNKYADDGAAARFGHLLFFDARLSRTGTVSCASCHIAEKNFQDGLRVGHGVSDGTRRTMPIAGTARSSWYFWDGRADSQWEQALGPLENPVEHGGDRTQYALLVAKEYRTVYESVFGQLPSLRGLPAHAGPVPATASAEAWMRLSSARRDDITRVYANIGKAIAAYERRIDFAPTRFDRYVAAELAGVPQTSASAFSSDEVAGLRLFIGKANCANCHNGASFSDNHFHNTGVSPLQPESAPDSGRSVGVVKALAAEFSCTSRYSDAAPGECAELRFAATDDASLVRAFKPPSLRNVVDRAPYMHAGQLASLGDVLEHYSSAPRAALGHSELKPLHLSVAERRQIIAFLGTLTGPLTAPAGYLSAPSTR
jgi:cytochrome c peroxidase